MVEGERAGYFVITPFALAGRRLGAGEPRLGALGKRAAPNGRPFRSPAMSAGCAAAPTICRAPAFRWAPAQLAPPYPVVAAFPTRAELAQLLQESPWTPATDLVLLDPGEPDGYVRNWSPPGFPPMRHIGYAVQWFALALTLA